MKRQLLLLAAAAVLAGPAIAAGDHTKGHDHKPQYGGLVAESGDMDFELVAKADGVTLYVNDHGKPAKLTGATGKITVLSGTEKTEAVLAPAGDVKLEAKGSFKVGPGTKFVAMINIPDKKVINVRFAQK